MHTGTVAIVGAGPGDPELLTLKAADYLHKAEVVLTDRLVSERILQRYVNPVAAIIWVGKEGRKEQSVPQKNINQLLVQYAQQGRRVVRLKGGDISVFSNILDELETLRAHNIAYELVPGITAAIGAAAYAGIPLTARGFSNAVRFLTCYREDSYSPAQWHELAATDDTLVFYMSGGLLQQLAENLLRYGINPDKSVAVIEQATTPYQRVFVHKFSEWTAAAADRDFVSPTLLIIGYVAGLHEQFGWLTEPVAVQPYFPAVQENVDEKTLLIH